MNKETEVAKKKYSIGQVLYFIPANKNVVLPLLIVEEINKKTLKGEETSFLVQFSSDAEKTASLNEMQGEIFDSLKEIQKELNNRANKAIDKLIANAQKSAVQWYKLEEKTEQTAEDIKPVLGGPSQNHHDEEELEQSAVIVTLPDGTKARFKS